MHVEKKEMPKSMLELNVELSQEEFAPFIEKAAKKISREIKIDGFRPGNIPLAVLKQKIGEMSILEEAARLAINKTLAEAIKNNVSGQPVGQPKVDITKLAPDNPCAYKVQLAMIPDITLGQYKDLDMDPAKAEFDEAQFKKALDDIREMRAKEAVVERAAGEGDKAAVDIGMFVDNVPIEGGQSRDTMVVIGKDYIIPGFDKNIIGMKKGDVKEFKLPYPKEHYMKNLAGKMVDFKVKVKEIYERTVPELDDEFARGFGLKSAQELKNNIRAHIEGEKKKEAGQKTEKKMLEKILSKAKFGEIPELLLESETRNMAGELKENVASQGGKFEDYLKSINKTENELLLDFLPDALKRVKISLLIREISLKEKIKASEEEIENHIKGMKEHYREAKTKEAENILERISAPDYRAYAENILTSRKVLDKLMKWNIKNN